MILYPYKIVALRRIDEDNENILPYAPFDVRYENMAVSPVYSNPEGSTFPVPLQCDANGEANIWLEDGAYKIKVGDGQYFDVYIGDNYAAIDAALGISGREEKSNKAQNLISPNETTYPSTKAVKDALDSVSAGQTPMGAWNASTNTPELASGVGTAGNYYEVSVAGTTDLDGEDVWQVGDKAIFNGSIWTRVPANSVRSVDGFIGDVVLNYDTSSQAALASLPVGTKYSIKGFSAIGDGFIGDYVVASSSSSAADGFNVIAHSDGKFGIRQPVKNYYLYSKEAISSRAPMRSDFKDFNTGNLPAWVCDDGVYAVNRVSGTYATWIKDRSFRPLIGDMAIPSAIWWLSKVVSAYAGQCINVTNETLATSSDIGFDQFGNLDTLALAKFLRGSRGLVNTWYDQSGNGHDLTSSGANRPVINSVKKVGSLYGVIFETGTIYNGVTIPDQFMTIPSSLTGTSNSVTMGCLCSFASSLRDAPIIELAGSDSNFTAIGKRNASGSSGFNVYQNSAQRVNSLHQPKIADNFLMASIGASTINYWGNDTVSAAGTSLSGVSFAGGKVGGTTNIFVNASSVAQNGGGIIAGLFVSNSVHSVSLQRQLFRACAEQYKITPQARANIVFDGDSITEGAGATNFDNTSSNFNERSYYPVRVYNVGQGGGTTSSQNANRSRWVTQIYKSGAPMNLIVLGIGTNNLNAGNSSATVISGIQEYIDAVKLVGYEIVLCSILPRASFISTAKETERLAVNDHLKNNWQSMGAIGYVNYDNEGTMGRNTFVVNTSYYFDGTHPTTDGYALLATYIAHTVEPIIGRLISRY